MPCTQPDTAQGAIQFTPGHSRVADVAHLLILQKEMRLGPKAIRPENYEKMTEAESVIVAYLEKCEGRKLTEAKINLSLDQARAIGELEGEPTHYIPLCGVIARERERKRKGSK